MRDAMTTNARARTALIALIIAAPAALPAQEATPEPGWLGMSVEEVWTLRDGQCHLAVTVEQVYPGAPADRAGLRPGDQLVRVNEHAADEGLRRLMGMLRAGQEVRFTLERGDDVRELAAVAGRRPSSLAPVSRYRATDRPVPPPPASPAELPRLTGVFRVSEDSVIVCGNAFGGRVVVAPRADMEFRIVQARADSLRHILTRRAMEARIAVDTLNERVLVVGPRPPKAVTAGEAPRPAPPGVIWIGEQPVPSADSMRVAITFPSAPSATEKVAESYVRAGDPDAHDVAWSTIRRGSRAVAGAEFAELNPDLARYFRNARHGLLVLQVVPGTPAARAGLRPGDVVVAGADREVTSVDDLRVLVAVRADRPITLEVVRDGRTRTLRLPRD